MIARLLLAVMAIAAIGCPALAADDLHFACLYAGQSFQQGQQVCIRVDGRERLALCDKVLNNSSWTFLPGGCQPGPAQSSPAN